ncbi:sensor histidine kinase [Ramlibacter sp. MAHUQ-53]|uniref:sensor histidine kinase n=1 Tax=unclassified Ramlibacter TaxID=2617605 RepID=UPI003643AEA1
MTFRLFSVTFNWRISPARWFLALALAWLPALAFAQSEPLPPPLRLAQAKKLDLKRHAQVLRDSSGALTAAEVLQAPAAQWSNLTGELSEGFTASAIWLRFRLAREAADDPTSWYLALGQPLLMDVRLYAIDREGRPHERLGTTLSAEARRELALRQPTFHILKQDEAADLYLLRISTQTALNSTIELHPQESLLLQHSRENFIWGLMFGAYAFVVVFYAFYWTWTRERLHLWYLGYVGINFLAALFTSGWPIQYVDAMPSGTYVTWLGIWLALSLTSGMFFSTEFIRLPDHAPRLSTALRYMAMALTAVGLVLVLGGQYRTIVPVMQLVSISVIALLLVLALRLALAGDRESRIFLVAFSPFYLGVCWRYLRNIGWIEPTFWNDNSYQIGAFAHMMVMSVAIFAGYNKLMRDKDAAETRLRLETQLREDQGKFIDMVSHEFKTPLSVVQASVDNLRALHSGEEGLLKRLDKIERANHRMSSLITSYLTTERLLLDACSPDLGWHDLAAVCRLAIDDLPEPERGRITLEITAPARVMCDAGLLRIAIGNLLRNACDHSPEEEPVTLRQHQADNQLVIQVLDQGEGIAGDDREHLFKRYFRGRHTHKPAGTGLGLYIARSIVDRHHGTIRVEANTPRGSVFTITLPA